MIGNYKYFGARKFPEIDKILIINDSNDNNQEKLQMQDSLCANSISDGMSIMPSISITDG